VQISFDTNKHLVSCAVGIYPHLQIQLQIRIHVYLQRLRTLPWKRCGCDAGPLVHLNSLLTLAMSQKSSYRNEAARSSRLLSESTIPLPPSSCLGKHSFVCQQQQQQPTLLQLLAGVELDCQPRFGIDVHDRKGPNMGEEVFKLE